MFYAIIGVDREDSLQARMQARPGHLERLNRLRDQGRLLLAGPFPSIDSEDPGSSGFSGSLIVAEFDDLAQAKAWAGEDPYMLTGVYTKVTVKPFKKVLP
ncbi:MAG: YciI family protein [Gammaproteobacteria bacterium]|nr:YciI family protein [Gammaproteobacteria bacterium]MCP5418191.1 YciI family protein [Chromatiaceae bacterium]